jgi:hypothetical protein
VGFEIPVSWSNPLSGGDRREKGSRAIDDTSREEDRRVLKINFLGEQRYRPSESYFFSVILFKKSL